MRIIVGMKTRPAAHTPALIRLLDEQGWDATTVDTLAHQVGVSRATFFRTFGSKEDVVFHDHGVLLEELEAFLDGVEPGAEATDEALVEAVLRVFRHHAGDPAQAHARYRLLRQSKALRNRELLSSHGYERLFARWLRGRLDGTAGGEATAFGLAGAVVAVHNAALRDWLRTGAETGTLPDPLEAEQRLASRLESVVGALTGRPAAGTSPGAVTGSAGAARSAGGAGTRTQAAASGASRVRTVVVTVDDGRPDTDAVLASVRAALEG